MAGAYAGVAFGAGDLSRGAFSLDLPLELPTSRGAPLVQLFPSYSPDAGASEWGIGWSAMLSIRRWRASGALDFATDDLIGPWGRMRQGTDGAYYPVGLASSVRLVVIGDELVATLPDGTSWRFGGSERTVAPRGTYEWYLTEVRSLEGAVTRLSYDANTSGRRFLSHVQYGGFGESFQYRVDLAYQPVETSFVDYRSSRAVLLDRRVAQVAVFTKDAASSTFKERWHYALDYASDLWGPGYYLKSIQRTFASGASDPVVRYSYALGADELLQARFRPVAELTTILQTAGDDAFQPERSTLVDIDEDGRVDFEHADHQTLYLRTDDGFEPRPLDVAPSNIYLPCRPPPSPYNVPRNLVRMEPNDEVSVVLLESDLFGGSTAMSVCSRAGVRLRTETIPGTWELGPNVRLVDIDLDDRPELLRLVAGAYTLLPNTSQGHAYSWGAARSGALQPYVEPQATWVYDMNGDGLPDLVAQDTAAMYIWYGTGGFGFASQGTALPIQTEMGLAVDLEGKAVHFVDANKDGLTDLLTTQDSSFQLYVNDGHALVAKSVPALDMLDFTVSTPVVADLAASGNVEITVVRRGAAESLGLVSAQTGLLVEADDGRGTRLRLGYDRGPADPHVVARPSVLASLTILAPGEEPVTYSYDYGAPRPHSQAKYLIGFGRVHRVSPQLWEEVHFYNDDDVSARVLETTERDFRTPTVVSSARTDYEESVFRGIRWLRPLLEERGSRSPDGAVKLVSTLRYLDYTDICATHTETTTSSGTLEQIVTLSHPTGLTGALHCLPAEERRIGRHTHTDSALNFDMREKLTRNDLGQIVSVEQVGPQGSLVTEEASYDAHHRIEWVSNPASGRTTVTYDDSTGIAKSLTGPDGVVMAATSMDAVRDSVYALITQHGTSSLAESFRFDDHERLVRRWKSFGGSSEDVPLEELSYEYASVDSFGALGSRTLADAVSRIYRESVDWSTAAGQRVGSAFRIPGGWSVKSLAIKNRNALETSQFRRDPLPAGTDVKHMRADTLLSGAVPLGLLRESGLGKAVHQQTVIQSGVQRHLETSYRLVPGALLIETVENGAITTERAVDELGKLIWTKDAEGGFTRFTYDVLGRLVRVVLPDGATHRIRFDDLGRPVSVIRDGVGTISYEYDALGRLGRKTVTSPNGVTERHVELRYDPFGRLTERAGTLHGTGQVDSTRFRYDGTTAAAVAPDQTGFLTHIDHGPWSRDIRYNPDETIAKAVDTFGAWRSVTLESTYYPDGSPQTVTRTIRRASDNAVLETTSWRHRLDSFGRIAFVDLNGAPFAQVTYDAEGRLDRVLLSSGDTASYAYDGATHAQSGYSLRQAGSTTGMAWAFDARGLRSLETLSFDAATTQRRYTYDRRGFLTQSEDLASGPISTYSYDLSSMPISASDSLGSRSLTRQAHELLAGGVSYRYDDLGRIVKKGALDLRYGPDGQLAEASRASDHFQFYYDDKGNRVLKLRNGVPVAAYVAGGYLTEDGFIEAVTVAGVLVGMLERGQLRPIATDSRGTSLRDETGRPSLATPYGVRLEHSRLSEALDFVEKGFDPDLGTVRMGVRDYDPFLQQFWTPDPLFLESPERCAESPTECNLYAYARNNPILHADPSGTTGVCIASPRCVDGNLAPTVEDANALKKGTTLLFAVFGGWLGLGSTAGAAASEEAVRQSIKFAIEHPRIFNLLVGLGFGTAGYSADGPASTSPARSAVWSLNPFKRGMQISMQLGENLPVNFKTFDKFVNGVATSIKSRDLGSYIYQKGGVLLATAMEDINAIATFSEYTLSGVTLRAEAIVERVLQIAIPPGATMTQYMELGLIKLYGMYRNVNVIVTVVP